MKDILIVIGLLFIVLVANATVRQEETLTVLVTNEGFLGNGRGSGVLLDENHVLTCAHMATTPKDELFVYTYPLGSVIRATPEFMDKDADLMVLTLASPVAIAKPPVFEIHWTEGDPITVIGNALGSMKWVVSAGVVSGEEQEYLLTDARINPGNSGGPWFDKDGSIVAITDWGIGPAEGRQGIAGGVSATAIENFLQARENARVGREMLQKLLGV